jgi:hypothetical protein
LDGTKDYTWIKVAPLRVSRKPEHIRKKAYPTRFSPSKGPVETFVLPPPLKVEEKVKVDTEGLSRPPSDEVRLPSVENQVTKVEVQVSEKLKEAIVTGPVMKPEEVIITSQTKRLFHPVMSTHSRNNMGYIALAAALVFIIGSVSVTGLLQSNVNVVSSGLVIRTEVPSPTPLPPSPPPEPRIEIDVYSDVDCVDKLIEVEWGAIEVGSSIDRTIYVKNAGDVEVVLSLLTENWAPSAMAEDVELEWDYGGRPVRAGDVVEITLTLLVDSSTSTIGGFSFDIVIVGSSS